MDEQKISVSPVGSVTVRAALPHGTRVEVLVETFTLDGQALTAASTPIDAAVIENNIEPSPPVKRVIALPWKNEAVREGTAAAWMQITRMAQSLVSAEAGLLLGLTLALYLVVHFVGLAQYPIYFFTDEAIQAVHATNLVKNGLRSGQEYLPTFFVNGGQYNLGVSVYLQVIPNLLFGQSIPVTRGTSVMVSLLAAVCVALTMKNSFNQRHYWLAAMLLMITPAWFLHSRTAFETVLAVSFYAAFLYFYMRYRQHSPRNLYAAIVFAVLAFYSYSPAQMVVGLTALLLFLSDIRYHWQQRKFILRGLILIVICALPYLRFLDLHPNENARHLQILNSYWVQNISFWEKLKIYFGHYLGGFNPLYWYFPNLMDLERHLMKGYGHVLGLTLPLLLVGLFSCLRQFRKTEYRVLLIAFLAAPSGAALAQLGITRALFMVIPLCLISAVGLMVMINWLERLKVPQAAAALLLFMVMAGGSVFMLRDVLVNGPTWFRNYGLMGMQYGGEQLFSAVGKFIEENPDNKVLVSPTWANGTDVIADYFFPQGKPFEMGSVRGHILELRPLSDTDVFIVTPDEYAEVKKETKFKDVKVLQTLPYPDGLPGFYFIQLKYAGDAEAIFAAEAEQRRSLQEGDVTLEGQTVRVQYSLLDMGEIRSAFDNDQNTLVRTYEANPLRMLLTLPEPVRLEAVSAQVGGTATRLSVTLYPADGGPAQTISAEVEESNESRLVTVQFTALEVTRLEIEVLNINDGEPAHVHLWEVILK